MTNEEAIKTIKANFPSGGYEDLREALDMAIEALQEKDGVIVVLTQEEARIVRKVLQCANQLYTVIEPEYKENKIDPLIRKLRRAEEERRD